MAQAEGEGEPRERKAVKNSRERGKERVNAYACGCVEVEEWLSKIL